MPAPAPGMAPVVVPAAPKRVNPIIFVLLGVMLLGVLGACGLGWLLFLRPMDAATYEDRVSEIVITTADSVMTMGEAFNNVDAEYDEAIGDENLSMLRDSVAEGISAVETARSDIKSLRPPKEYKSAHERLVTSYDEMLDGMAVLDDMMSEITAEDSSSTLGEKFSDQSDEFASKLEKASSDMQEALEDMGLYESLSDDLSNMF